MSSELHKYIETAIEKKQNLFNADVLSFPKKKELIALKISVSIIKLTGILTTMQIMIN